MATAEPTRDYKDLYEVAKAVLAEETARNTRLDEKAARMISGLSVVIVIYGFYGQWLLKHIPPTSLLEVLVLVFSGFTLLFLVLAWARAFNVFRISAYAKLPFGSGTFDLHRQLQKDQFLFSLSKTIERAIRENRQIGNRKVEALTDSFRMLFCTAFCLFVLVVLVVLHTWITPSPTDGKTSKSANSQTTKGLKE